jgi:hypothetical protein
MKTILRLSIIGLLLFLALPGRGAAGSSARASADGPAARFGHTMTNVNDNVYLFGGLAPGNPNPQNDLWEYNSAGNNWSQVLASGPPPARAYQSATAVGSQLALTVGGRPSSASALTAPQEAQDVFDACTPITEDTTWTTGNVYTATDCNVVVPVGVTLTVQPGVVVKFAGVGYSDVEGSVALIVEGTLDVQGTATETVAFTSLADDAHGGDTNSDGASSGSAGEWYGLVFQPGSTGRMEHFFVGYAGSGVFNNTLALGYGRAQIDVKDAAVTLRDGTVTDGLEKGIYLEGEGITPVIERVDVANNNAAYGRGSAIYQSSINMQPSYADLIFSGNDQNEVTIGRFNYPMTEDAILGGANYGFDCGSTVCVMEVSTHTLTVMPGTLLDFSSHYGTGSLGSPYGIAVADGGTLIAEGTPTQPITFTSQLAAEGADLQNWAGIWAQEGSTLRLDHCDISYARNTNYNFAGGGGLEINTDDAEVQNCHIHHNADDGVAIKSDSESTIHPTFADVDVTDNGERGVYLSAARSSILRLTWEGGNISSNGYSGVYGSTSASNIYPTLKNVTISNNGSLGSYYYQEKGINFNVLKIGIHPVLENITLNGNTGGAMTWYCDGNITARNLTATGNDDSDELELPGCDVSSGRRWDLGEAGIPVRVTDHVEIPTNGLLSLAPGTTLRFDKNQYDSPTYLRVRDQAALYALGTAEQPIVFTGATAEPGSWLGIQAYYDNAAVILRHCEVAYGGNSSYANLYLRGNSVASPSPVLIQNCDIHHSPSRGVRLNYVTETPVFRDNSIHDNDQEGLTNENAPQLDARYNWWGDKSGPYHPTLNPDGLGETVGDNVLFDPWLTAPPAGETTAGGMFVSTGAPTQISPGQTVDYAVQYVNGLTQTVENALLMVQLPRSAEYVASSGGGIYWPERDQVFWALGDLEPGAADFLVFTVRFAWGLPRNYQDSSITIFSADNYNPGELDTQSYLDYTPGEVTDVGLLTTAELDARLSANADLRAAYDAAEAAGYTFHSAADVTRSEGETVLEVVMVDAGRRAARILTLEGANVLIYTINAGEVSIEDSTGGMRLDLLTGEKSGWGAWEAQTAAAASIPSFLTPLDATAAGCTVEACKSNCRWSIVGWDYIKKKAGRIVAWTALAPFTGGASLGGYVWEVGSTAKKIWDCDLDCRANPQEYCCTEGQVRWSGGGLAGGMTNSCFKETCNAAVGKWVPGGFKPCVAGMTTGERCVPGIRAKGCVECNERNTAQAYQAYQTYTVTLATPASTADAQETCSAAAAGGLPRCRDLELLLAKDPNLIYGPEGDLLPGATLNYTITYENEGAGRAYGVYVINELPEVLDESTLELYGAGQYIESSREIFWFVGELGPKGDPDSEGVITYTVALTGGLPSGTVVSNQAVVYFPSVPEETPTNVWVNVVSPLAAIPQNLTTDYATPLSITLRGREISGLPLTYTIVEAPHGGTLTGTLPNLTYTPVENFTGADGFTFRVSNGVTTSRPAQVYVTVTSEGDETPPEVTWTSPQADATVAVSATTPVFTDALGPAYAPIVLIGVSEPLNETTVSSATVTLATGGTPVSSSARFDPATNQIVLTPRAALDSGQYTATVTTAVADRAGNALPATYVWQFTVAADSERKIYLPLVLRDA